MNNPVETNQQPMSSSISNPGPAQQPPAHQMPQQVPNQTQPPPAQQNPQGASILLIIGAVIILLVIIGGAYAILSTGSSPLDKALASSKNSAVPITTYIATSLNGSQQFNVSYSGSLIVSGQLLGSAGASTLNIPLTLSYSKFGQNSRVNLMLIGIPLLGTINQTIFLLGKSSYSCTASALSFGSSKSSGTTCTNITAASQQSSIISALKAGFANVTVNITSQSSASYNGNSCRLAVGKFSIPSQSGSSAAANGNFSACFSEQYAVPLNITLNAAGTTSGQNSSISMSLHEVSIGEPVSSAYVSTLPANVTAQGLSNLPTTTLPTGSSGNYSASSLAGNITCTPVSAIFNCSYATNPVMTGPVYYYNSNFNGTRTGTFVNFWIGQNSGQSWNNVNITFVPAGTALNATGVPKVPFNFSDSVNQQTMPSSQSSISALVIDLPVSSGTSGPYAGTVWAKYFTSGQPGWQYTKMATISVTT